MADNNNAEARTLEEAAADRRRLEAEKARARVEMQRSGSGEAMGRYQAARAAVENARHRERITRQEMEHGRGGDVRGRVKMAELWRRRLRLEEARTWQLAFMWAASTADHLAEETAWGVLERWILRIATRRGRAERSRQDETVSFCDASGGMHGLWW